MSLRLSTSTAKVWSNTKGFSLVEVLLSGALFALLVTALMGAYLYGQESTSLAGRRVRAVFLAEEGLEATRNIANNVFGNLSDGSYGLVISGNQWTFSGSTDITDIFTRQVTISTVDADRKQIDSQVTWQQNPQRTGEVVLTTYLSNWQSLVAPVTNCPEYCQSLAYTDGTCRKNPVQCNNNGETNETGGDQYCTVNPNDTCCCSSAVVDTTPPAAITNLDLSGATSNSINLAWTAPGDDDNTDTATTYDIRYSTLPITEANWSTATQVSGEPSPSIAGSAESMTVSSLSPSTTYYFAMKTSDEVPNISSISNVPNFDTLAVTINSCLEYCQSLAYTDATCRKKPGDCNKNGEIYESGGDQYCTVTPNDTCCCLP